MSTSSNSHSRFGARPRTARSGVRLNAWLSGLLLAAIGGVSYQLVQQHVSWRQDFSEDQLYALSGASQRILGDLDDRLQVTTYFTGAMESGQLALAKAHVQGQLQELRALSGGHMEVIALDPSSSSQAAAQAARLGIEPVTQESQQGTQFVRQSVFFGMQLQYRGREQVLDVVDPRSFEVQFVSAAYALVRDKRAKVGWLGTWEPSAHNAVTATRSSYASARALVGRRHEVVDVKGLEYGDPLPPGLDLLVVMRPEELHPRVAFEVDQFVQRGGRLIAIVDQADYSWLGLERAGFERGLDPKPSGLHTLLKTWGAPPTPQHVWDLSWAAEHGWLRPQAPDPETGKHRAAQEVCRSPLFVEVREQGMHATHPVMTGLQQLTLGWAQPIAPVPVPEGVQRTALLRSSPEAHRTDIADRHVTDQEAIDARSVIEAGAGSGSEYDLAVVLEGPLPSPFEDGAPAPYDVLLDDDPTTTTRTTEETVLSRASQARVAVFGDADWLRDGDRYGLFPFINRRENQLLLMNLVDWMTQGDDLIDLRRRVPRQRDLIDFEQEGLRESGLMHLSAANTQAELDRRLSEVERLRGAARLKEARAMWTPVLVALGWVLAFGLVWNLSRRGKEGS